MPRTIESIEKSHRIAEERLKKGMPLWDRKLAIKHLLIGGNNNSDLDEDENAQEVGRKIATALRSSSWFRADKKASKDVGFSKVEGIAEKFEYIYDLYEFNDVLDMLYDMADADRVWIA